jgi:Protein of unknown function (DUF3499)
MRCSRVGCGGDAVASFCFDGRAALVWVDPLDAERGTGAGVLCARHADTLTPPRGWHLQDRRVRAPRLWDDRPAVPVVPRRRGLRGGARPGQPATAPPAVPLPLAPDEHDVHRPTGDPAELERLLDARTPLLARAFGGVRDV